MQVRRAQISLMKRAQNTHLQAELLKSTVFNEIDGLAKQGSRIRFFLHNRYFPVPQEK